MLRCIVCNKPIIKKGHGPAPIYCSRRCTSHAFYVKVRANRRWNDLKRKHGVTKEEYEWMLKSQDGKCAICGTTQPDNAGVKSTMCVDHDHVTGKNRGLLCNRCNRVLGLMLDSPELFRHAAAYLDKWLRPLG